MALIVEEIRIARTQSEVFEYASDLSRFSEWQSGVVSGHLVGDDVPRVGSRCVITHQIGGSEQTATSEITQIDPPRTWAIHGIEGVVRADIEVRVTALSANQGSHVAIHLNFFGQGIGKMILPMVIRQARKEVKESCENLKKRRRRRPSIKG